MAVSFCRLFFFKDIPGCIIYLHVICSLTIHIYVCVCQSGSLPGWLGYVLLQKSLMKISRAWGLSENSGSLSPFQPSTLIPYLSYTEVMPNFLSCKNSMAFSIWKTTIPHNGEGIYFRGQETDLKSSETVISLEIWPIRYSFRKWLSFKVSLSVENTQLLIPLGKWV